MVIGMVRVSHIRPAASLQVRLLKSAGLSPGFVATLSAQDDIPKHNRLAKEPSRKQRSFAHTGTFAKTYADGRMQWSDTGSYDLAGPGDLVKASDPRAANFASPSSR